MATKKETTAAAEVAATETKKATTAAKAAAGETKKKAATTAKAAATETKKKTTTTAKNATATKKKAAAPAEAAAAETKQAAAAPAEVPAAETKKTTAKKPAKAAKKAVVTIKLVRSFAHRGENQIATCKSLGLRHIGDVTTQPDNAATRGKIAKICHLVEIIKEA